MRMTDVHTVAPGGEGTAQTFDLVSLLQLPAGRMTTANVRWALAPISLPGGATGVQARPGPTSSEGSRWIWLRVSGVKCSPACDARCMLMGLLTALWCACGLLLWAAKDMSSVSKGKI